MLALGSQPSPTTIRATGEIHSVDQGDGIFELVASGPRTYRTTTTNNFGTYVYLMNDGIGAVTFGGKTRHIGGAQVMADRCAFLPFYSFIGEAGRSDVILRPIKAGSINGNPTYILSTVVTDSSNPLTSLQSVSEMEVDAKSFLPQKLRTQLVHSENTEIVSHLEYSYSDYRREGAFQLPHDIDERGWNVSVYSDSE